MSIIPLFFFFIFLSILFPSFRCCLASRVCRSPRLVLLLPLAPLVLLPLACATPPSNLDSAFSASTGGSLGGRGDGQRDRAGAREAALWSPLLRLAVQGRRGREQRLFSNSLDNGLFVLVTGSHPQAPSDGNSTRQIDRHTIRSQRIGIWGQW